MEVVLLIPSGGPWTLECNNEETAKVKERARHHGEEDVHVKLAKKSNADPLLPIPKKGMSSDPTHGKLRN